MTQLLEQDTTSYFHTTGDIPTNIAEGTFISLERKPPLKIQALGFQPAKSIPEISRWFLQKYGTSASFSLLEPFAGSGTTLIKSIQHNTSVYWLDYQPLSRLICQVKTTRYEPLQVLEEALQVIKRANWQDVIPETINFANKDFWFQKPVQAGLEILRQQVSNAKPCVQSVLWLIFAATVRKTSDMNDGMILAARRSHITEIPVRSRYDVFKYFRFFTDKAVEAIVEWNIRLDNSTSQIVELPSQDARKLEGNWQCDAVVTSPPYINAIDYVWASKFELHWLGMVANDEARLALYAHEIGTERLPKEECKALGHTGNLRLDLLIDDIYTGKSYQATSGQNKLRARVVYQYFMDMKQHFASSIARLRPGGYYCLSIGDISKICGVDIPVAAILTEIACEVGFKENFHFHLLLKNRKLNVPRNVAWAGTIKHDTIIVLEKPLQ